MSVKVADTIESMSDFPSMMAKSLNIVKEDGTEKNLQAMYEDGELGGGDSLPIPESKDKLLITTENAETSELEWTQVDKNEVGDVIHEYTLDEWEALSEDDKPPVGSKVIIKNDTESSMIDDESVSSSKVWSSRKVSEGLVNAFKWNLAGSLTNTASTLDLPTDFNELCCYCDYGANVGSTFIIPKQLLEIRQYFSQLSWVNKDKWNVFFQYRVKISDNKIQMYDVYSESTSLSSNFTLYVYFR